MLPNKPEFVADPIRAQLASFGLRLKELRLRRGWTIQCLATASGLSKAFISRLESGDRQASIAAVLTLAGIFGVSLSSMFETGLAVDPCVIVRSTEVPPQFSNGLAYVPLSNAERFFNLQPLRILVSPQRQGNEHFQHNGEEWIYVLSGHLRLSLAGKTYDLHPGDAAHFDSQQPHRLIALGQQDAELLLVACPLAESKSFPTTPSKQHRAISLINPQLPDENPHPRNLWNNPQE